MTLCSLVLALSCAAVAQAEPETSPVAAATAEAGACPSGADMALLAALHQRRLQLDAREVDLMEREKGLETLRLSLDKKMAGLSADIEKLEAHYNLGEPARQARTKRLNTLVEAMSGLSPKKAAPMLAAADADLVGDLLMRMGATRTAALLAIMPVQKAAKLMEQMGGAATAHASSATETAPSAAANGLGGGSNQAPQPISAGAAAAGAGSQK
jgi:flagellar motility protein MotE (MotC chaperone)